MNVLSLFDGMSCGQIALKELGVKINKYYASEVDKFAIEQTQLNFPETIQLGDVSKINTDILPKIDLLIGGSPCQNFSFSGRMNGMTTESGIEITTLEQYMDLKEKGFEFDGQSYLFWEYVRILKAVKPKYFLLENVVMAKKWERLLNGVIGLHPVEINSSLVSAQNRVRLYWSNIKTKEVGLFGELHSGIPQPKDRKLYLRDILEDSVDDKFYLSDKRINTTYKRGTLNTFLKTNNKIGCLVAYYYKIPSDGNYIMHETPKAVLDLGFKFKQDSRVYSINGKSPTLLASNPQDKSKILEYSGRIRRLTPTECARLQTIPDWYKWECSDTQQYRMLGNGWTVEVIKHIFKYLYE